MKVEVGDPDLSLGSGGIWTKWSISESEVPMYRFPSRNSTQLILISSLVPSADRGTLAKRVLRTNGPVSFGWISLSGELEVIVQATTSLVGYEAHKSHMLDERGFEVGGGGG